MAAGGASLASGIDPADERKSPGATSTEGAPSNTFEAIAREWFAKTFAGLGARTWRQDHTPT